MAVAQWVRHWNVGHRVVQAEVSIPGGATYQTFFSAMIFNSVLSGLMEFSNIVMLRSRSNSCCRQNLKCLGLFS